MTTSSRTPPTISAVDEKFHSNIFVLLLRSGFHLG